jgi:uncharacterized protein (TIGR02145 family)
MGLFCAGNTKAQNTKNSLLFYRLEKNGSYILISDTAGKYANAADLKISKEENVEVYYRYEGSDYTKALYTGEMSKIKLESGKVELPNGTGVLNSANLNYSGGWKVGNMHGSGDWAFDGEKYLGEMQQNAFHGRGKLFFKSGFELVLSDYGSVKAIALDGEWENDSANGNGKLTYLNEYTAAEKELINLSGEPIIWKGLRPTGKIEKVKFTNGNTYEGELKMGRVAGNGDLHYTVDGFSKPFHKKGLWENGSFTGTVEMPLADNRFYQGSIKYDKRHGIGKITYADGSEYSGNWENDVRSGAGKYLWKEGTYYEGEWKNNNRNGFGTAKVKNGSTWKCNWKDNIPCDSGLVTYLNGGIYTGGVSGKLENGSIYYYFEGYGKYFIKFPSEDTSLLNDSTYAGYYKAGRANGKGKMIRNGNGGTSPIKLRVYEGDWVDNQMNGIGRELLENYMGGNITFDGGWHNGIRQGKGVQLIDEALQRVTTTGIWENGQLNGYAEEDATHGPSGMDEHFIYKGNFTNGIKNGKGTELNAEGAFAGNWLDGTKEGFGKMVYKDGRVYEGAWKNGSPNGHGVLTLANKTMLKGMFENGEYQKPKSYSAVVIGGQAWMSENLETSIFRNGDEIPEAKNAEEWHNAAEKGKAAWCYYGFNPENGKKYGKLYNNYAAKDARGLAPIGWHIPSDAEWNLLCDNWGGIYEAGKKLKSTSGWDGQQGNNYSGFNGLPGGFCDEWGSFKELTSKGRWWTSSGDSRWLYGFGDIFDKGGFTYSGFGLSVRCIKD